jgi:hypothetical protein
MPEAHYSHRAGPFGAYRRLEVFFGQSHSASAQAPTAGE